MLYVALLALALNALIVFGFLNFAARSARSHARREDLLINQVCHLARNPWQEAPAHLEVLPDLGDIDEEDLFVDAENEA